MKSHIFIIFLILLGILNASQYPTTITFLVEYEDEQQEDYIQLGLTVSAEGSSLIKVMKQALQVAEQIKSIATQFCQAHTQNKSDCKKIVDIGNYHIKPLYQVAKRQSKFQGKILIIEGFQVKHEVAIQVVAVDDISDLADRILKKQNTKIDSFKWKPLKKVNKEQAVIKKGTRNGGLLCHELKMQFDSIQNVEEMTKEETQSTVVYKFEIKCLPKKKNVNLSKTLSTKQSKVSVKQSKASAKESKESVKKSKISAKESKTSVKQSKSQKLQKKQQKISAENINQRIKEANKKQNKNEEILDNSKNENEDKNFEKKKLANKTNEEL